MSESLAWGKMGGLLPVIVQHAQTRQVLMLGYMNAQSLEQTRASGRVTFFSRSRNRIWVKGESSGNYLRFVSLVSDCDQDSLLVFAVPEGPTCHRGTTSCFGDETAPGIGFLGKLWALVENRYDDRPEGSYTTKLFNSGIDRMAQKVGEEGVEVVIAAKNEDRQALLGESADLVFHLMVLLRAKGLTFPEVVETLRERHH